MSTRARLLTDQALSRTAGSPLVAGNAVRLLRDAEENYPAWLDAIRGAQSFIHLESYILRDDEAGGPFIEALAERAAAGVRVRVLTDWLGGVGALSALVPWRLRRRGIDARAFNPLRPDRPLGWMSRDHRKIVAVDGRVAYVAGLGIGNAWTGVPEKQLEPWRDTGVEIIGPAVADVHQHFAQIWATTGRPVDVDEVPSREAIAPAGAISVRVIGTAPAAAGMLRLDALVASLVRQRLWITDAYFVGTPGHVQTLMAAAADGVDVRLLVPGGSDLPLLRPITQAGYRPLLEAGVRVFEWNGAMIHAKTAVADGSWSRVGSTNLNLQSWMGNWELDVAVEDEGFATEMEAQFERDLGNATEVVLEEGPARRRARPARGSGLPAPTGGTRRPPRRLDQIGHRLRWRSGRATARALGLGRTFGAALTARRSLGTAELLALVYGGLLFAGLGAIGLKWPRGLAYPLAVLALWLGITLFVDAMKVWWQGRAPSGRTAAGRPSPHAPDVSRVDHTFSGGEAGPPGAAPTSANPEPAPRGTP